MSVPPDIMQMLQQGGGAGGAGPMPDDIMALLGGGGEPAPAEAPAGALHGGAAADGDPENEYREALALLEAGIKEDVDEARIQTILQCITKIQGELAASQKGTDGMAAGNFDAATMRRMSAADTAY